MSYQVVDTTAGLQQAMTLLKPAMRGMPEKWRYKARYTSLCRQVAQLIMLIDDGEAYFSEDGKTARKQKAATEATKAAKAAVTAAEPTRISL